MATGGLGKTPGTGGLDGFLATPPPTQDLTQDGLLAGAPRAELDGTPRPTLGDVVLLSKLGQGGMGAVYYGVNVSLGTEVAVKVLPLQLAAQQPELRKRFVREARLAGKVNSPNLIYVYDVGEELGLCYQVMEYVRGVSAGGYLKQLKKKGQTGLAETEALAICIAAATGLAAAHAKGIIHRDIKPDNILIPPAAGGTDLDFAGAKVADLGLARQEEGGESLTGTSSAMGTPGFMPPEQSMSAKKAGKPADVFALGATLYSLLAGKPPFTGDTAMAIMIATLQQPHTPLPGLRPDVSAATVELIDRCLAKKPEERYADAAQLRKALEDCLAAITAPPEVAPWEAETVPSNKRRAPAAPRPASEPPAFAQTKQAGAAVAPEASRPRRNRMPIFIGVGILALGLVTFIAVRSGSVERPVADIERVNLPDTEILDLGNGVKLELVLIPAGKFIMGSPETERERAKDETQHEVTITKPFYMGRYEVTQEQYEAVMRKHSGAFGGARNPVDSVSWGEAQEFCKKATANLSRDPTGAEQPLARARGSELVVRLPTEAEWEYACRAGTTTRFFSGDAESALGDVAWHNSANSDSRTHPVGQKKPNSWGLYDMHGNVWEWCQDWYYVEYGEGTVTDPKGVATGEFRVLRGGSWSSGPRDCRSANRGRISPFNQGISNGFRVVVVAAPRTL